MTLIEEETATAKRKWMQKGTKKLQAAHFWMQKVTNKLQAEHFPTDRSPPVWSSLPLVAWPVLVLRLYIIIIYTQGTRDAVHKHSIRFIIRSGPEPPMTYPVLLSRPSKDGFARLDGRLRKNARLSYVGQ